MPRRRCPICRSKEWHKEPSSGLVICSEGHVLQNYRSETNERTEFRYAVRRRSVNVRDNQGNAHEMRNDEVYHGARARYLYFQCLQLLLRLQIKVLMDEWKLPEEFEIVCRDVWALDLTLLRNPPEPEPYFENDGADKPDTPSSSSSSSDPDSESDSGDRDGDPRIIDELLKEASESESESSQDHEDELTKRKAVNRPRKARNRYEVPAGNIAVLALACWTMRLPVMYKDLIRLIEEYKLPYLEGVRLLPPEMKRHLSRETVSMLSPHFPPTVIALHRLTSRLARLCWTKFTVHTPEMNTAPLLWRLVAAMKGGATLYELTKIMGGELSMSLTLDGSLGKGRTGDNVPAEVALAGALMVVLKLIYGLDGRRREDLGVGLPEWEAYVGTFEREDREIYLESSTDENILHMSENEMDVYLRFCERALVHVDEDKTVAEFFPLTAGSTRGVSPSSLPGPPSVAGIEAATCRTSDTTSAGIIRIYHSLDSLGSLPPAFQLVLDRAARFCAVDADVLASLVERYEHRLVQRAERMRKEADT